MGSSPWAMLLTWQQACFPQDRLSDVTEGKRALSGFVLLEVLLHVHACCTGSDLA